jgi:hypothetical protein
MSIIRVLPEIVAVVRVKTSDVTAVVVEVAVEDEEDEDDPPQSVELTEKLERVWLLGIDIETRLAKAFGTRLNELEEMVY